MATVDESLFLNFKASTRAKAIEALKQALATASSRQKVDSSSSMLLRAVNGDWEAMEESMEESMAAISIERQRGSDAEAPQEFHAKIAAACAFLCKAPQRTVAAMASTILAPAIEAARNNTFFPSSMEDLLVEAASSCLAAAQSPSASEASMRATAMLTCFDKDILDGKGLKDPCSGEKFSDALSKAASKGCQRGLFRETLNEGDLALQRLSQQRKAPFSGTLFSRILGGEEGLAFHSKKMREQGIEPSPSWIGCSIEFIEWAYGVAMDDNPSVSARQRAGNAMELASWPALAKPLTAFMAKVEPSGLWRPSLLDSFDRWSDIFGNDIINVTKEVAKADQPVSLADAAASRGRIEAAQALAALGARWDPSLNAKVLRAVAEANDGDIAKTNQNEAQAKL